MIVERQQDERRDPCWRDKRAERGLARSVSFISLRFVPGEKDISI
jgi:hypothetical protein